MTHARQPLRPVAHVPLRGLVALGVVALALCLTVLGCQSSTPTPEIPTATPTPTRDATRIALQTDTPAPGSPTPATPTSTASPTPCPSPPAGWVPYTVQPGDTLFGLASLAGVSQEQVMRVNCLDLAALMAGQWLYLPPLPTATPTPCVASPPAGWVAYTVRPGDTLFGLAVARETTTEEVMRVNCLASSSIQAGQVLYLAPLPFVVEPPSSTEPPIAGPTEDLPVWRLETGGPGEGSVRACERTTTGVDMLAPPYPPPVNPTSIELVEVGERRYFFACGFQAQPVSASVTFENGQTVAATLLDALPNGELEMNTAQAVIDWPVLPEHPLGVTTVTITDADGQFRTTEFEAVPPTRPHILAVVPNYSTPTRLVVYYVYFDRGSNLTFEFYRQDQPPGKDYTATKRDEWSVLIDRPLVTASNKGWASRPLTAETASGPAALVIVYDQSTYGLYWWLPW